MGKQHNYRFPRSINQNERFFCPDRQKQNANYPTNYVTDVFGLNDMVSDKDVLGSYTGVPTDDLDMPVQDADDL